MTPHQTPNQLMSLLLVYLPHPTPLSSNPLVQLPQVEVEHLGMESSPREVWVVFLQVEKQAWKRRACVFLGWSGRGS